MGPESILCFTVISVSLQFKIPNFAQFKIPTILITALEKAVIKSIGKLLQCIGSGSDKVRTSPNVPATESNIFFSNIFQRLARVMWR